MASASLAAAQMAMRVAAAMVMVCLVLSLTRGAVAISVLTQAPACWSTLTAGSSLVEGSYTLKMQTDCNLVLYHINTVLWDSKTSGRGTNCRFTLQADG